MPNVLSEDQALDLVGRIYDAAAEPEFWPSFLERLAEAIQGGQAQIVLYSLEHRHGNLTATARQDPLLKAQYDQYYGALDCWGAHGRHLMRGGNVVTGQMLCPDSVLSSSEFYQDFLRRADAFHQVCGFVYKEENAAALISTLRPQRVGPFGEEAMQLLRTLLPHLQRALHLHRRIVELGSMANSASAALNRCPFGFLAMDRSGKVLLLNQRAQRILDLNDGLSLSRRGLIARRQEETYRLRGLIRGAIATASGKGLASGGAMLISRPSLRRSFQVLVTPLPQGGSCLYPQQSAAGVFVTDPESSGAPAAQMLGRLFGLTPAEARLAALLMQGKSLDEAAESFNLSRNTLRSQLRSIFDKTGTKRQGELVRLLLSSPAQFQLP